MAIADLIFLPRTGAAAGAGGKVDIAHGLQRHANQKAQRIARRAHEHLHGDVSRNVMRKRTARPEQERGCGKTDPHATES